MTIAHTAIVPSAQYYVELMQLHQTFASLQFSDESNSTAVAKWDSCLGVPH